MKDYPVKTKVFNALVVEIEKDHETKLMKPKGKDYSYIGIVQNAERQNSEEVSPNQKDLLNKTVTRKADMVRLLSQCHPDKVGDQIAAEALDEVCKSFAATCPEILRWFSTVIKFGKDIQNKAELIACLAETEGTEVFAGMELDDIHQKLHDSGYLKKRESLRQDLDKYGMTYDKRPRGNTNWTKKT